MKPKIFIDGREGTTGLQIDRYLSGRGDLELLPIDPARRKDPSERKKLLNAADLVFLCLPDKEARAAVAMIENPAVRVVDASTAHRTAPGWAYGFPELSAEHRAAIARSKRVANPGCHASGFIALVYPLVKLGILSPDSPLTAHSITGYSGGGRKMIAQYEAEDRDPSLDSPRQYGLTLQHKHLPEMQAVCGLSRPPVFSPIVADFYAGMEVTVPLHTEAAGGRGAAALRDTLAEFYEGAQFVSVAPFGTGDADGFLPANAIAGSNRLEISVWGTGEQVLLVSRFDNLGKGASGAAVQNMNLMLGLAESRGLN
jgi:N-acetyl-gamma-glutamyl-phosphate reductase